MFVKPENYTNDYLLATPRGAELAEVMAAAIQAVDAENAVRRYLRIEKNFLRVGNRQFNLDDIKRLIVVGAGKAGAAMAKAAAEILGEKITGGIVITKDGHSDAKSYGGVEIVEAAHPVPDERGVTASKRLEELVSDLNENDFVLVLISGGGSALSTLPADDLTLADLQKLTRQLLRCGATIDEINCLRKHLTELAGGGLAQKAFPAQICSLIISDVVGSPLGVIASGLTAPDSTTFADARRVVERYELAAELPPAISEHLRRGLRGEIPDTPKADDKLWKNVSNFIIADNPAAAESAIEKAREFDFDAEILTVCLEGEASQAGRDIAAIARNFSQNNLDKPLLLVAGGETTVTVKGDGKGGRNQKLALGAVKDLSGLENVVLATLATDGGDGAGDAAGAVVDGKTLESAETLGFEAEDFLRRNDSYNFFEPLGALLKPGATLTNVNDLLFVLITPPNHEK